MTTAMRAHLMKMPFDKVVPGKTLGAFLGWPRREGSAKGDKSPEKYPGAGS